MSTHFFYVYFLGEGDAFDKFNQKKKDGFSGPASNVVLIFFASVGMIFHVLDVLFFTYCQCR